MPCCYIIYSKNLDRFYIGTSQDVEDRILKHNNHFYGTNRYTAIANDWELFLKIDCVSHVQALKIEKHIKAMKTRKYILNLIRYPSIIEKLLCKYK